MKNIRIFRLVGVVSLGLLVLCNARPVAAGFWNDMGAILDDVVSEQGTGKKVESLLSNDEIAAGLKEALAVGFTRAVESAGAKDGFWNNMQIRIPEPKALQQTAGLLNQVGMAGTVDNFRYTMNQAASQAAGEAMPVLTGAIKKMTFQDVKKLWKGDDHAVTDFFKDTTSSELRRRFTPIVQEKLNIVGVTSLYQDIASQPLVAMTLGSQLPELDQYVTDKTLDGLFALMADEEQKIRNDPAARTSQILRQVFGR